MKTQLGLHQEAISRLRTEVTEVTTSRLSIEEKYQTTLQETATLRAQVALQFQPPRTPAEAVRES